MKLSVVLTTYQRADLLRGQIEALVTQEDDGAWELVVADNGSTDGTLELVETYRDRVPELRVVVADEQRRPPHVLNAGAKAASGDAFLFLNDDDVVAPGWMTAMRAGLERHHAVAARVDWGALNEEWAVGPRGKPQQNAPATWWGGAGPPFAASGTVGVRRSAHEAIGGFDEEFVTCEDVDYCWRLGFAGYDLEFAPDAVVRMRARSTVREIYRQARAWGEGDVALYAKHRSRLAPFPHPLLRGVAGWLGMLLLLAQVRGKPGVANLARHVGWRVGLIRGSLKHRVLMLSD